MRERGTGIFLITKNKRGQLTLFIIIAIIIVGLGLLIYFFVLKPEVKVVFDEGNPNAFIQSCMENKMRDVINKISLQGGVLEPEFYFDYNHTKISYLCYVSVEGSPCVIQQPLLKNKIESEIKRGIEGDVRDCFNSLKESYERRKYKVIMDEGATTVNILPKKIVSNFNYRLTVSKGGQTNRYESFGVNLKSDLYQLIGITNRILIFEHYQGDVNPNAYISLGGPNIIIVKNLREDQTKIYAIENKNTGDRFQFASKSFTFPIFH
ncbi:MAG: hypothetical protein QXU40_00655 [Candidatus Pacearchaeota archaeon]